MSGERKASNDMTALHLLYVGMSSGVCSLSIFSAWVVFPRRTSSAYIKLLDDDGVVDAYGLRLPGAKPDRGTSSGQLRQMRF